MLSNSDFAAAAASEQPEKVRFDYKQIATWDKQNEAQQKKQAKFGARFSKGEGGKGVGGDGDHTAGSGEGGASYRDRAMERRQELKDGHVDEFEGIVSKLAPEQTKYLGGDVEHTHLVKGLDYALLNKSRIDAAAAVGESKHVEDDRNTVNAAAVGAASVESSLGVRLRYTLFPTASSSSVSRKLGRPLLHGTSFEFAGYSNGMEIGDDIPSFVSRSNLESEAETFMVSSVSQSLIERLTQALDSAASISKKRKKPEAAGSNGTTAAQAPEEHKQKLIVKSEIWGSCDDIYGGIVDMKESVGSSSIVAATTEVGQLFRSETPQVPIDAVETTIITSILSRGPKFSSPEMSVNSHSYGDIPHFESYGEYYDRDDQDSDGGKASTGTKSFKKGKPQPATESNTSSSGSSNRAARRAAARTEK
jgi:hypothetical protein